MGKKPESRALLVQGFSTLALWTFWTGEFFVVGANLSVLASPAASQPLSTRCQCISSQMVPIQDVSVMGTTV